MNLATLGRSVLVAGTVLVGIGLVLLASARFGIPLGRLPGDISFGSGNVRVYVPIVSCIALSLLLTIALRVFGR